MTPNSPFLSRQLRETRTCEVFISSGADLQRERDLVKRILQAADGVLVHELREIGSPRITPVTWEDAAPRRRSVQVNDAFIKLAKESHLTIVMIGKSLPPGTKDELLGVLDTPKVQVSVIHVQDGNDTVEDDVNIMLAELRAREVLYKSLTGTDRHTEFVATVVEVVCQTLIAVLRGDIGGVES